MLTRYCTHYFQLGITDVFSASADLSEMLSTSGALRVSKVVHKAFIDVNEEGSEAAAATGKILNQYQNEITAFA